MLQTLLMKGSQYVLGFESFKWSTAKIMNKLGWVTIYNMIVKDSILFTHKVLFEGIPLAINKYYTYSLNQEHDNMRNIRNAIIKIDHNSMKATKSHIYKSIYLLNKFPYSIGTDNPLKLSKYL